MHNISPFITGMALFTVIIIGSLGWTFSYQLFKDKEKLQADNTDLKKKLGREQ